MYYYGDFVGHPFFGGFFMLIFWVCIIAGIIWLFRSGRAQGGHGMCCHGDNGHGHSSALDILKERYARGEINKDEFDAKKKDLSE